MNVTVEKISSVASLGADWSALEARGNDSFFLSWPWIESWLIESGVTPYVLRARDDSGRTVAMALLHARPVHRHGILPINALSLHEVGDPGHNSVAIEYNGLLVVDDAPKETVARCLDFLARSELVNERRRDWDEIRLSGVPSRYLGEAAGTGLKVWITARSPCFAVDLRGLPPGEGSYLATLGHNTRYQIRRALRLYAERGPVVGEAVDNVADALKNLDALRALHQTHWQRRGQPGAFAEEFFVRFHRRLIARALPLGMIELFHVRAGDHTIGYLYNFLYKGTVYNYLSGFNYEANNRLKPGLVSHYLGVERHRALGHSRYDLMAGDMRYKHNLAKPHAELLWITVQRPRPALLLEEMLRAIKIRLDRIPPLGRWLSRKSPRIS
jgi:CelD/BcsL family acetyltransferase involved in cellulose biosynthesis